MAEFQALLAVYRAAGQAHEGHVVEAPLRAPIHLLRASDRGGAEAFEDQRPAWGWGECTRAWVLVGDVPGTHITMLTPPQVAVLAERLAAILEAGERAESAQAEEASGAESAQAAGAAGSGALIPDPVGARAAGEARAAVTPARR